MMFLHGANPILFNQKIKIGRPEPLLLPPPQNPDPLLSLTSHFCLTTPLPSKWTSYVYHQLVALTILLKSNYITKISFKKVNAMRNSKSWETTVWCFSIWL